MNTKQALEKLLAFPLDELAEVLQTNYSTCGGYRHKFKKGGLSKEKQEEILMKAGMIKVQEEKWTF